MPAVMVTSLTTEKVENVRIVLLTTVKVGSSVSPTVKTNSEGGERPQRSYGDHLTATVLSVLLTIVKVETIRIVLASIATMKEADVATSTTAKVVNNVLMIVLTPFLQP